MKGQPTKEASVAWRGGMAFDAAIDGFRLSLDAAEEFGGTNQGPRPKNLLLAAVAGCTAMDVIAILDKMRVAAVGLEVSARGTLSAEHPKKFEHIVTTYRFAGDDLPLSKLRRAVQLSEERYCGVRATLEPAVRFETEIFVNDAPLAVEQMAVS